MSDKPTFSATKAKHHAGRSAHEGHKQRAQVCVTRIRLCDADPAPEDQEPGLTGFYQEKTSGQRPRYTMQVNQAGDHVRVWVRRVLHSGYAEDAQQRMQYYGRRAPGSDEFRLFVDLFRWDCNDGVLSGSPSKVTFRGSGITGDNLPQLEFELCKVGSVKAATAVFPDRVRQMLDADSNPAAKKLAAQEYYRLPAYDFERLATEVDDPRFWARVLQFLDTPRYEPGDPKNHAWALWNQRILDLDNYVATRFLQRQPRVGTEVTGQGASATLGAPNGSPDSWHSSDEDLMRAVTTTALEAVIRERQGESGSLLAWVQRAVMSRDNVAEHPLSWPAYEDFIALKFLLGVGHSRDLRSDPYEYTFRVFGLDVKVPVPEIPILGGRAIVAGVQIFEDETRVGDFGLYVVGATAGMSLSVADLRGSYKVTSIARWAPNEFSGPVSLLDASTSYGAGGVAAAAKVGAFLFHGSGSHQPLVADLSGTSISKPNKVPDEVKLGFSHGATLGTGYLFRESFLDGGLPKFFESEPTPVVDIYSKTLDERQRLFFMEGDAMLTPWGRQVLGMFCADELRMLQSPETTIRIIGYTDPEGSDESNQNLSFHRAHNTLVGFNDALGAALQAEIEKVEGLGELPARVQGHVRDNAEDPYWRTVHVIVDDSIRLQLRAPRWRKKRK